MTVECATATGTVTGALALEERGGSVQAAVAAIDTIGRGVDTVEPVGRTGTMGLRAVGTTILRVRSAGTAAFGSYSARIRSTSRLGLPLIRPMISSTLPGLRYFETIAITVRLSSPDSSSGYNCE